MKLLILIILTSLLLQSCSGNNVKESPDDIASINDEELMGDPLMGDNSNSDNEIASLEDDLLFEGAPASAPVPEEATPAPILTPDIATTEASQPMLEEAQAPSTINQDVSGLMVLDNETQAWISADKCLHIIKNDLYKEPTCLKTR